VPVVSEDPRPYYPTTDYSSEEGSWSDISTTTPYQERNIYKTAHPEGAYRELAGDKVFIFTYIPGLRDPIRAYKPHRHCLNHYSNNPNYQASLYKPYYHRVLTAAEQKGKIIQTYIKPKEEDLAPVSLVSSERLTTEISEIKFCQFNKHFTTATPEHIHLSCHKYQDNILHEQKSDALMHPWRQR